MSSSPLRVRVNSGIIISALRRFPNGIRTGSFRLPGVLVSLPMAFFFLPACVWHGEAGETDASPATASSSTDTNQPATNRQVIDGVLTADALSMEEGGVSRQVTLDAHLEVEQDVQIMASMSGIVEEITVDRGSRVSKGDLLLRLENRDLSLILERTEIIRDQMEKGFQRAKTLFEKNLIPRSDFEEKDLEWKRAQVDVKIAREILEDSLVRAPFDGLIMDRFAKIGQKIIEDENRPLFRLTTLAPLQAKLFLREEIAGYLREGDEVEILPRYLPGVSVPGRIEWISRVIDASSGTTLAIVTVPDHGAFGELRPGASVTVRIALNGGSGGVLVPIAALGGEDSVVRSASALIEVLDGDRRTWRRVRLGQVYGKRIEILEGLQAGETVVLRSPDRQ